MAKQRETEMNVEKMFEKKKYELSISILLQSFDPPLYHLCPWSSVYGSMGLS